MSEEKLRVVVFTHGGAEAVLTRLAALPEVELVGVFIETETTRQYPWREKIRRSIRYDGYAATFAKTLRQVLGGAGETDVNDGASGRRESIAEVARSLGTPVHYVNNYHTEQSMALVRAAAPDLGVIYGTNILKESVFNIPRLGSINLHRGLVPYYRGGPAVFWELFNGENKAGLTIHHVAAKVDAGEVIVQETVPLEYDYSFGLDYEAFIKNFQEQHRERCAQLISQAVQQIATNTSAPWAQDLTLGQRYRLPTKKEKDEMRRRLRARRSEAAVSRADLGKELVGKR